MLHEVVCRITKTEPRRVDGGWTPERALREPPASEVCISAVHDEKIVVYVPCGELHSTVGDRKKRMNKSENVVHGIRNTTQHRRQRF